MRHSHQSVIVGARTVGFHRIVFTDFDGVLHSAQGPNGRMLPFEWVTILADELAAFTDVGVCVHSSWREQFADDYLRDFLGPLASRFAGAVPRGAKAAAIAQFLHAQPRIVDALVLDDEPDEVRNCGAMILPCDPQLGISCSQTRRRLRAWLRSTPSPMS